MLKRGYLLPFLVLFAGQATGAEKSWELRGRVLDQQRRPVADVEISTFWNANGVTLEDRRRFGSDEAKMTTNEGRMEPWGHHPTKTDADGNFSMKLGWRDYNLLAIDKERKRGAVIVLDPQNAPPLVEIKLLPLVRLHGTARIAKTGQHPKWVTVVVRLPPNEKFPLSGDRLAVCSSLKSRFEFWLPPGDYQLEALGEMSGLHHLVPYRSVTVAAGQHGVDSGTLKLTPRPPVRDRIRDAKAKGKWGDYTKLYGQPPPNWHVVDARGIPKNAQISGFKGKWILIYSWGPWCAPCLGKTLPALMEFYKAHEGQRDRFEIVAICIDANGELKTMADVDQELKPIVKSVWRGKQLPFPVILDNTLKTSENFGLEGVGQLLLIDPAGRLVKGDEKTLAKKLEDITQMGQE